MIARTQRNTKRNSNRFHNPAPDAIPDLWRELSAMATLVPPNEAAGVHQMRSRLLASVPSWQLPAVLDSLACEGATA